MTETHSHSPSRRALGADVDAKRQRSAGGATGSSFSLLASDLSHLVSTMMTAQSSITQAGRGEPSTPLQRIGGIQDLARILHVQLDCGLSTQQNAPPSLQARQQWFGVNYIPPRRPKSILEMMFATAFKDPTNLVLVVVAVVSIALGVSVGVDPAKDWMEGTCVLAAVLVIALVSALTDAQKEKQFQTLNVVNDNEKVQVIRNGEPCEVGKWGLVVGDVVRLAVGDILPADGLAFDARELHIDESAMTGESELVVKSDFDSQSLLLAGTKVMEGFGKMLVLCVGEHSQYGHMLKLIRGGQSSSSQDAKTEASKAAVKDHGLEDSSGQDVYLEVLTPLSLDSHHQHGEPTSSADISVNDYTSEERTPLGIKLDRLNLLLGKIGIVVALLVFSIMSVRFSIETFAVDKQEWRAELLSNYLSYFLLAVTVLVVAIPEGLPLAVAIALAHSVKQMLRDNNLVRHLNACETAGNATTICSDKTGTLTTNSMSVARVWVHDGSLSSSGNDKAGLLASRHQDAQVSPPLASAEVRAAFCEGIAVNSTAELLDSDTSGSDGVSSSSSGSKTECALLEFIRDRCGADYRQLRKEANVGHVLTFSSEKKRMSVVVGGRSGDDKCRVYTKGAAEVVLALCTKIQHADGSVEPLFSSTMSLAQATIDQFASQGYRTICLAYRDVDSPMEIANKWSDEHIERELMCLAIVGIEDPVRPEVPGAVAACERAGVVVRMVTGDNVLTACSIARQCGILPQCVDGYDTSKLVMDGPSFRDRVLDARGNLVQSEFDKIWPTLRVLARSSPTDKYHLVQGLKQTRLEPFGEQLVVVTGDGTNDAPALKKAHVGFAMGVCGTSVAKEASDIILMDDNFHSIVNAIKWGRNVYDAIAKFLQFQLTVILVAVTLACLGGIVLSQSPITAVQILWVNLFMDSFASLALATEAPTPALLERKPYARGKPLISRKMAKHIVGQACYQFTLLTLLTFYGHEWFNIVSGRISREDKEEHGGAPRASQHMTIVFNTFAWMQLFNELNCRKIHDERNVFGRTLWSNRLFIGGWAIQVALQVLIVELGGELFHCVSLTWPQWIACVGMGAIALPLGFVLRLLPVDEWLRPSPSS
ncbi:hypothetical protein Gpo141_00009059 [Globisporangium polare]